MIVANVLIFSIISLFLSETKATRLLTEDELEDQPATTVASPDAVNPYDSVTCDFDLRTLCEWRNKDQDFKWQLGQGRDSFSRRGRGKTGAKDDSGGGGQYIYINAGRGANRIAYLMSPQFQQTQSACLSFMYHMRGRHIGHLKIYAIIFAPSTIDTNEYDVQSTSLFWTVSGQQGSNWQKGQVRIPALIDSKHRRQLMIQGYDLESGKAGNIALDDIRFSKEGSACNLSPPWAIPPETTKSYHSTHETTTAPISTSQAAIVRDEVTNDTTASGLKTTTGIQAASYNTTIVSQYTSGLLQTTMIITTARTTPAVTAITMPVTSELTQTTFVADGPPFYVTTMMKNKRIMTNATMKMNQHTPKLGGGVISGEKPGRKANVIWIAIGGSAGAIILLLVAWLAYRIKKKRKFEYYDNCTVHMARIATEDAKQSENEMQYYKLS